MEQVLSELRSLSLWSLDHKLVWPDDAKPIKDTGSWLALANLLLYLLLLFLLFWLLRLLSISLLPLLLLL